MQLVFTKYTPKDLPLVRELFFSNVPLYFKEFEWEEFEQFLNSSMAELYYTGRLNEKLIACGGIGTKEEGVVSMCWGMVHANYHKKGYGMELLKFRLNLCSELYTNSTIEVKTTQLTFGFFEKFGFKTTETKDNFWAPGLHLYLMEKNNEG